MNLKSILTLFVSTSHLTLPSHTLAPRKNRRPTCSLEKTLGQALQGILSRPQMYIDACNRCFLDFWLLQVSC